MCPTARKIELSQGLILRRSREKRYEFIRYTETLQFSNKFTDFYLHHVNRKNQEIRWGLREKGNTVKRQL